MPNDHKPRARQKTVSSGTGVHLRGNGLGTGPVGHGSGGRGSGGGVSRGAIGGGGIGLIAVIFFIAKLLGGGGSGSTPEGYGQGGSNGTNYMASSAGEVDRTVASGSRAKYTAIKGDGTDKVTIMTYMCGTDLESKHGMATNDLQEMAAATLGKNVNMIVMTGGCKQWKISNISSTVNQIYRVADGKIELLENDMGSKAMTDPNNLSAFIKYCAKKYPANRNELILWDHGGGSVSGYGYDEKNKNAGSMDLGGISKALSAGGVKFDFVGFDACLMATAETALMLNDYADYMIASEETEPGIGWYYTDWLTALGKDTAMPTVDLGKMIVDSFVEKCAQRCPGQGTTLSVVDLAEFSNTVPSKLGGFSKSVTGLLSDEKYKTVSDARYGTREFAISSKIDQVDLADLSQNIGTDEGKALAKAIKGAVKYNRTSSTMSNAYGVSIYFPYRRTGYVDRACSTYSSIGMDSEYSKAIRQFASMETTGQVASGGTQSPVSSLFDLGFSGTGASGNSDMVSSLLSAFLSGGSDRSITGLDDGNTDFMNDMSLSENDTADYVAANLFDPSKLVWKDEGGNKTIELDKEQWSLVHSLDMNMFVDNGKGYVDMGFDNIYSFDGDKLVADLDCDWMSINGQPVAYYHADTVENGDDYTISGYVPVLLNGERAELLLRFDNANPEGYVAGAVSVYTDGETETVAKSVTELESGDSIDFICDFYDYDGNYSDSYLMGTQIVYDGNLKITNTPVGKCRITYRFTDIYEQEYWTEAIHMDN